MGKTKNSFKLHLFSIFFLLFSLFLYAEVTVNIELPEGFYDELSENDNDQYWEYQIRSNIDYFENGELKSLVNNMLTKPNVTEALSHSMGLSSSLPQLAHSYNNQRSYLFFGTDAALISPYFDKDKLEDYAATITVEDDPRLGAGLQALQAGFGIPLYRWVPRLDINASGGHLYYQKDAFLLENYSIQGNLQYRIFRHRRINQSIQWTPLELRVGGGFRFLDLHIKIETGTIYQSLEVDADGPGPSFPQTLEIQAEPRFYIRLQTQALSFPLQLGTEFTFFDQFHIALGGAFLPSWSSSGIGLEGEGDVFFLGYIAEILKITEEDSGKITASGITQGEPGTLYSGYGWFRLQIDMGTLFLNVPVLYQPPDALGVGFYLGVNL